MGAIPCTDADDLLSCSATVGNLGERGRARHPYLGMTLGYFACAKDKRKRTGLPFKAWIRTARKRHCSGRESNPALWGILSRWVLTRWTNPPNVNQGHKVGMWRLRANPAASLRRWHSTRLRRENIQLGMATWCTWIHLQPCPDPLLIPSDIL